MKYVSLIPCTVLIAIAVAGESMARAMPSYELSNTSDTVTTGGKCGTATAMAAIGSERLLSARVLAETRPMLQTELTSPSGKFVIHFDTTGVNTPSMLDGGGSPIAGTFRAFAESVAVAFDLAWQEEISVLGYAPPPSDGVEGGNDLYDVYLIDQTNGVFGQTIFQDPPISTSPNFKHASWIEVDNDFAGLRTSGLQGMRVTAAHEFFHAVQVGTYGFWSKSDFYWYELTASWMEDRVFPDVDDYVYDIQSFFTTFRTNAFTTLSSLWPGYERAVFAHYLAKRFGPSVIRGIWEQIATQRIVPAIRAALRERGVSLEQTFSEFALWNFYTSDRADTVAYYSDGKKYPRLVPLASGSAIGMNMSLSYDFAAMSQGHFAFAVSGDTIVSVLARTDDGTTGAATQIGSIVLSVADLTLPRQLLAGGWQAGLNVEHPELWEVEYLSSATRTPVIRLGPKASPNPWVLSSLRDLTIPVAAGSRDPVNVYFVSPAFDVVNIGEFSAQPEHGAMSVRIPASKLAGRIGSGTYTVLVRTSGQETLLKIAILR